MYSKFKINTLLETRIRRLKEQGEEYKGNWKFKWVGTSSNKNKVERVWNKLDIEECKLRFERIERCHSEGSRW